MGKSRGVTDPLVADPHFCDQPARLCVRDQGCAQLEHRRKIMGFKPDCHGPRDARRERDFEA